MININKIFSDVLQLKEKYDKCENEKDIIFTNLQNLNNSYDTKFKNMATFLSKMFKELQTETDCNRLKQLIIRYSRNFKEIESSLNNLKEENIKKTNFITKEMTDFQTKYNLRVKGGNKKKTRQLEKKHWQKKTKKRLKKKIN